MTQAISKHWNLLEKELLEKHYNFIIYVKNELLWVKNQIYAKSPKLNLEQNGKKFT